MLHELCRLPMDGFLSGIMSFTVIYSMKASSDLWRSINDKLVLTSVSTPPFGGCVQSQASLEDLIFCWLLLDPFPDFLLLMVSEALSVQNVERLLITNKNDMERGVSFA